MKEELKNTIRKVLQWMHLDLTRNLKYDRLTKKIIQKAVVPGLGCVDVGCHKGEILELMLAANPKGPFWAFEPIPEMVEALRRKYGTIAHISDCALSDTSGSTTFNYVKNAPAYSGILPRKYATEHPEVEMLTVQKCRLDDIIKQGEKIGFIKIDVEGGELPVLRGASRIIGEQKPFVLFECGLGASEHYGTRPEDVFNFFSSNGLGIWLTEDFLKNRNPLSAKAFEGHFERNDEYYFVAGPLNQAKS